MRAREWQSFCRQRLLGGVPDLVLSGSVVHDADVSALLRGVTKNSSGFSDRFCVEVFVQPLFVPSDHLSFSYGGRLGPSGVGSDYWWSSEPSAREVVGEDVARLVREVALPWLTARGTLSALAESILGSPQFHLDINCLEALAGAASLAHNGGLADSAFTLADAVVPSHPWEADARARVVQLADLWSTSPDLARAELRRRAAETATTLRLR